MIESANATSKRNQCQCNCGTQVRNRFAQGHDARLKGRLLTASRSVDWWTREPAVNEMVAQGWGKYLDSYTLANTPVRNRHAGRFVESRHIKSLQGVVLDDSHTMHSIWYCPSSTSFGHWTKDTDGWACSTCIHTHDLSEIAMDDARNQWVMKAAGLTDNEEI